MNSFYNTNLESGNTLTRSEQKCKSQEEEILEHFQFMGKGLTASEVHTRFIQYPLTSVRRGITNLTKAGKLRKTGLQRLGIYGKMTYIYTLRIEYKQPKLF